MLRLIGKTQWDSSAIEAMGAGRDHKRPFSVFKADESMHYFWTIGMPFSEPILREFCKSNRMAVHYDHEYLVATSSTDGWHETAQKMAESDNKKLREFVSVFVQTFPELFQNLRRRVRADGSTAIMKYTGN